MNLMNFMLLTASFVASILLSFSWYAFLCRNALVTISKWLMILNTPANQILTNSEN